MGTTLITDIVDGYKNLMEKRHPRSDGWFLMSSPFPTLFICVVYVYFVKSLGPRLMANRRPFELKTAVKIYNILQVIVSTYLVYGGLVHAWLWRYSYHCQPIDYSDDPDELVGFKLCYIYFLCKLVEFTDTIFFVLRKKFDQITHLHVIHHTVMAAMVWWGTKFAPSGHGTFFGLVNSFVHIIMYAYYLVAAMGPQYQKYLWWKSYLTLIQMIQFVMVFVHNIQLFFNGCDYPKILVYIMCFNSAMFFVLFSNFYIQAYIKKRRLPNAKRNEDDQASLAVRQSQPVDSTVINNNNTEFMGSLSDFVTKIAGACFIGQNGLYVPTSNEGPAKATRSKTKKAE